MSNRSLYRTICLCFAVLAVAAAAWTDFSLKYFRRSQIERALRNESPSELRKILSKYKSANFEKLGASEYWKHPIHAAAGMRSAQCLSAILESGADANAVDYNGDSPLLHVIRSVDIQSSHGRECCELLFARGAKIDISDKAGWSLLVHAVSRSDEQIVHWFLEKGLDPNMKDKGGATALHEACDRRLKSAQDIRIIQDLLHFGAVDCIDDTGRRPSDYLKQWNNTDLNDVGSMALPTAQYGSAPLD